MAFPSTAVAGSRAVQNSGPSCLEAGTLETLGNSSETWAQYFVAVLAVVVLVVRSLLVAAAVVGDTKLLAKKQCLAQSVGR